MDMQDRSKSSQPISDKEVFSSEPFFPGQWNPFPVLPEEMEGFRLENIVGSGSVGKVYRATQTKEYAVKVFQCGTDSIREMARHEYETGKMFNECEEILQSLNYCESEHQSFLIMEYGVPCLEYFSGRACSMRDLLNTVLRISKTLEAIHAKGYSHFDVKPENIVMVKGEAKLSDFSHCSQFQCDQIYNRPMGTGVYMAPEITAGGKYTGREDMYSLGITMYTLLMAGRLPFDFAERKSKRRERTDTVDSLFIHPELLSIIQRAAAFDAADRFEGFQEFSGAIQTFIDSHSEKVDEKMPQYRVCPDFQQTVPPVTWDNDGFCEDGIDVKTS